MHDDRCEMGVFDGAPFAGKVVVACRCDYRALEAKLVSLEQELKCAHAFHDLVVKERDLARYQVGKAESRLAALRPLVGAAVLLHENEWGANDDWDALYDSTNDLTPEQVAWAKGGE